MTWRIWMPSEEQYLADKNGSRDSEDGDGPGSNTDTVIDALKYGNVGRFLNHRCDEGNLTKQLVLVDTLEPRLCRVAFFATDFIPRMTELTYDYGWSRPQQSGRKHRMHCCCGSANCRGLLL
mmetsp:Transcript_36561/g.73324  ORF Transcript_36561/g.73324 Transcript_36561/m.73324 type:complete len:122 (-) Transcript_36561:48-413(-)